LIVQSANVLTTTNEQIGIDGRGSYNLSGGSNTVTNTLTLSLNTNGRGIYNLSGTGNLQAGSVVVGAAGFATFNQSGGQFGVTQGSMLLGQNAGGSGVWALSGGSANPRSIVVGSNGIGRVDHSGGFNSATLDVRLGAGTAASGIYNLSGTGVLTLGDGANLLVGDGGIGTFAHTGGSFTTSSHVTLGNSPGSRGAYTLDGAGADLRSIFMTVGSGGAGTFTHNAGTHVIRSNTNGSNFLQLGTGTGSTGVYALNGGELTVEGVNSSERIGGNGAGTFVQTGGTHVVVGSQSIGDPSSGGAGTYLLSGGSLTVAFQNIAASGRFIQSGGASKVTDAGSVNGTYTLSGGVLTSARGLTVGGGTFIHSGGTLNLGEPPVIPGFPVASTGSLFVGGFDSGSGGLYRLAAGTLNGNGALAVIGNSGGGTGANTFEQTGGVNNFNGLMVIGNLDAASGGGGTYLFNGGALAVNPTTVVDIQSGLELVLDGLLLTNRGTFAANTPTGEFFGKFTHDGGTVTGVLRNRGTFVYNRGTFAGEMVNRGTFAMSGSATFAAPLTFTNDESGVINASGTFANGIINRGAINTTGPLVASSVSNSGAVNVPAGTSLAPAFVDNFGRIHLGGGRLAGGGTISNNATGPGGVISGGGTIQLNVVQNGGIIRADNPAIPLTLTSPPVVTDPASQIIVAPNARLNLLAAFNNSAVVALQGPGARLAGATITNTGTIKGSGEVSNQVVNNGLIRAEGTGELTFSDPNCGNFPTGHIQVGAGAVRFPTGMQLNSLGTISLAGGEFDNGAGSLGNSGRIIGRGTYRGGTLHNSGTVLFTGGVSDVFAPVVNANRISVSSNGAANFHGDVNTSVGTINVSLGSAAVFFGSFTGLDHLTGAGIKDFEAAASGGAISTAVGTTIVGPAGALNATSIRDGHLSLVGRATVSPNGSSSATSRVNVLEIDGSANDWNGRLDLTNNDLVIDYTGPSPLATVANQIRSGHAGGSWTGNGIATSSGNASNFALGYAESSAVRATFPATFSGQTIDATAILIAFTRYGDANLDGTVNLSDFNRLASNFGSTSAVWSQGDFTYDAIVNLADFNRLASNFGLSAGIDGRVDPEDWAALASAVPEPDSVAALALVGMLTLSDRRRRRHLAI
jgi:hypothetical protein